MRRKLFNWLVLFLGINSLVFLGIGSRYLQFFPETPDPVANLFTWVAFVTHFGSLPFALLLPLALLSLMIPSRRFLLWLTAGLMSLAAVLMIVDSFVFAAYRFHLNGMVWNLITGGAVKEILPLSATTVSISGGIVASIILLEFFFGTLLFRVAGERSIARSLKSILLLLFIVFCGQIFYVWADASGNVLITRQANYLPAYKPLTAKRLMRKIGVHPPDSGPSMRMVQESTLAYPLKPLVKTSQEGAFPNILVIMVDSLRFDVTNPSNTPRIWELADSSWQFTNHYSSGNSTRFGVFGFYYGMFATYWHSVLAEQQSPVLMRQVVQNGYDVEVHASAPLTNPEFHRTIFADLQGNIELKQSAEQVRDRDREITDKMLAFLDTRSDQQKPFFGFLFYDAPHAMTYPEGEEPFQPVLKEVNHLALDKNFDPQPYFNRFRNSIYYADRLVGEVLDRLREQGLLDSTVVIITGDHGEEFNELKNNYWGHNGSFSRFQTKVPLLIRWPGGEGRVFDHLSSHLDVAPTLMREIFDVANDPGDFSNGRYLNDTSPRDYVLASNWDKFAVIEPRQITVVYPSGTMETYSHDYQLLDANIEPALAAEVMKGMSRFLAR